MKAHHGVALLLAAALAAGSIQNANAGAAPIASATAGATSATGVAIAGGFIAVVGLIVGHDLWLKINGCKNWDGTPKKLTPRDALRCRL